MKQGIASIMRPANTTQYAAGDVITGTVAAVMTFGAPHEGTIVSGLLIDSSVEATKIDADLMLFSEAPTIAADNAAFSPTDDEMAYLQAVVTFAGSGFKAAAVNGAIQTANLQQGFIAPEGRLHGVLVARNTYTPVSGEVFTVKVSYA